MEADLVVSNVILQHFLKSSFFHVASLDLNDRKGFSTRYIPPHLRGGESDHPVKTFEDNKQEEFKDNRGPAGGYERDYNNR